jgi:hypothetical protein
MKSKETSAPGWRMRSGETAKQTHLDLLNEIRRASSRVGAGESAEQSHRESRDAPSFIPRRCPTILAKRIIYI